ncbi:type II toxin-antitoxin system RelB/DinJ family antitoxin [Loigolactobacillus zhaoyuanensis]|uniref:Type II toxin-antitoxin system RelB/DinJ family antitoxin n=1 Tax=Loigolactobacillus zhaoyuanensis TaxID=2486017 RepID=A0ABW8U969_9LACO
MTESTAKARISATVDPELKQQATAILSSMQLDMSTAINLFLGQVVKQNKLPFEVTNESIQQRELQAIRATVAQGVAQAHTDAGIDANAYLQQLIVAEQKLAK